MEYFAENIDVAVIGAGHAGVEASLAAARLGAKTVIFTINLDSVGNLPCNPAIGGTAKGQIVRELDALGGEMGKAADETSIQSRMLNRGKGPAVHSLRAQIDRRAYTERIKKALEDQPNLLLKQAEVTDIRKIDGGFEVVTKLGAVYHTKTAIFCTGTYLGGKVFIGDVNYESGPDGLFAATDLSNAIKALGVPLRRFKTGTPARVLKSSIDFSKLEVQEGDEPAYPFSYSTDTPPENKAVCHIAWTNDKTKEVILRNIHRSPLYGGDISGVGPRYCPSFEDKIMRFKDKKRHQLFIEPCGLNTQEMYLQGMSSSLPEDVQIEMYRTIEGLENVQIMRTAYAIEYDCIDPTGLNATLEFKDIEGLYGAGQFNGSSGYEEAAVQGFVAGVNAAHKVLGRPEFTLSRSNSYIGTLIDDLVTKGCNEPYRMMTSRSEYRLVLRHDNADERLMEYGRELGLIDDTQYERFLQRQVQIKAEIDRAESTFFPPTDELNEILESKGTSRVTTGIRLSDLIRRPQIDYDDLVSIDTNRPSDISKEVLESAQIAMKYEGYIKRQNAQIKEAQRLEEKTLPRDFDYNEIKGLRLEAREKLNKIRPANIGQAARISGVSPADISVLLIFFKS